MRGVESERILGLDKVQAKLRFALEILDLAQLGIGPSGSTSVFDVFDEVDQSIQGYVPQLERAVLDQLDAGFEFGFRPSMTGLTGVVDIQEWAAHMMVADLEGAFALVGHVTIGASHTGSGVNALAPSLKLRMLRFQSGGARVGMNPILELNLVVIGQDIVDGQSVGPRLDQTHFGAFEEEFHVTLAADVRAHFLAGSHRVHVVVFDPLDSLEGADAFDKSGAGDAELQGVRGMAIDAGNRMLDELARFEIGHLIHFFEPFEEVAFAQFPVGKVN